jgi:hypothetical protein
MNWLWPCVLALFDSSLRFVVSSLVQAEMADNELPTKASKLRGGFIRPIALNAKLATLQMSFLILEREK